MGAKTFIVRGLGKAESFHSCSHGAGRVLSRGEAFRKFSLEDHIKATAGVECRKDADVIDETPMAYKVPNLYSLIQWLTRLAGHQCCDGGPVRVS